MSASMEARSAKAQPAFSVAIWQGKAKWPRMPATSSALKAAVYRSKKRRTSASDMMACVLMGAAQSLQIPAGLSIHLLDGCGSISDKDKAQSSPFMTAVPRDFADL